jgi:hypothetical protein
LYEIDANSGFMDAAEDKPSGLAHKNLPGSSVGGSMAGGSMAGGNSKRNTLVKTGSRISMDFVKGSLSSQSKANGLNEPAVFEPRLRAWIQKKTKMFPDLASQAPLLNALLPIALPETRATKNLGGLLR